MINDLPKKQTPNYFLLIGFALGFFLIGFFVSSSILVSGFEQSLQQFECTKIEVLK